MPDAFLNSVIASCISALGHLVFAWNRPGADFDETQFDNWVTIINGGKAPTMGAAAAIRRFQFEAEALLTASLQAAVETPTAKISVRKPLPFAVRSARMDVIKRTFPGLNVEGGHEPGSMSVFISMTAASCVTYNHV